LCLVDIKQVNGKLISVLNYVLRLVYTLNGAE